MRIDTGEGAKGEAASAVASGEDKAAPTAAPALLDEGSPAQQIALAGGVTVTVRPAGPALIEVVVEPAAAGPKAVEIERQTPAGVRQGDKFERAAARGAGAPFRHLHAAKPGAEYAYRARSSGGWSAEIVVRTPTPGGPPAAPASATARAETPFAVRVAWQADAKGAAGFAVEVESKGAYVLAGVAGPTSREFVHHRRLPGASYGYRVRAFNALGASTPSAVAAVTTPVRSAASAGAKLPRCTRLPKEVNVSTSPASPRAALQTEGGRTLYDDPEGQGVRAMRRHLYGEYEGCLREFGAFQLQGGLSEVPGFFDEGFPLLHAIEGAGEYVGAQILTLRFAGGRYTVADSAYFCGEPWPDPDPNDPKLGTRGAGDDLTTFEPPFEACQYE